MPSRKPVASVKSRFARAAATVLLATMALLSPPAASQVETDRPPPVEGAKPVVLERIKVHSPAIEGNLEGNSAERDVIVVLPPSYRSDPTRRYPVVYALHGYFIGAEEWIQEIRIPQVAEGAFAKGVPEMIVVLPDSKTLHLGSVYSSSPTTGDFENFIARDLVAHIDSHYRTLPRRESRGLVGHSMGGYGATRIGMKHADVFGALYVMSPGGLEAQPIIVPEADAIAALHRITTREEGAAVEFPARGLLAMASAWSPKPNKPPLYLDLPFDAQGRPDEKVLRRWSANSPLGMLDQYVANLRRYAAIAMDIGNDDRTADVEALHARLLEYGIENSLEIYEGTHTSRVAFRFQDHVLPFFGKHLEFDAPPPPTSPEVAGDRGSGPYPAVMEVDPTLARHVIYRPADLDRMGDRKLGVYVWGNGGCSDDGASVRNHLLEIASHGYLVIASGFVGEELERVRAARGTPQPGTPPVSPTSTQDLVDGVDWALAQNELAGSKYRGRIDPDMIAASGFSCGGVQALGIATSDPRVKALIVHNSGLFPPDNAPVVPGMDLPKTALAKLTMPVLYVQGGPTDIAWDNGYDDFTRINHVPVALVGIPVGHGGTYFDPHGGAAAMMAVDWLEWQLRGDETAGRTFIGENCRICTTPGWTIERKNF
jgi:Enterochelin esterase and related enzymes